MKELTAINYTYRPASYWEWSDPLQAILSKISGRARREMITDFWNAGAADQLEDALLQDELESASKSQLGAIHPFFMGGEYLPRRLPEEVTLVRIDLNSTTYDVIELRAGPIPGDRIGLRWVDEYDTVFEQPAKHISRPFSFRELTEFMQLSWPEGWSHCPLPLHYTLSNAEYSCSPEELADFTSVSSAFYPDLALWFEELNTAWLESVRQSDEDEEEEEEEDDERLDEQPG